MWRRSFPAVIVSVLGRQSTIRQCEVRMDTEGSYLLLHVCGSTKFKAKGNADSNQQQANRQVLPTQLSLDYLLSAFWTNKILAKKSSKYKLMDLSRFRLTGRRGW